MSRDYLMTALNKKPALLSPRFNPDEYTIDLSTAKIESAIEHHAAAAKWLYGGAWADAANRKPFAFSEGVAVIPVTGVLLNRFPYSYSGATGYNAIRSQLTAAMADPDVLGIAFDIDSPGGMVQGCFELADEIYAARGEKPMMAIVDGDCCSAAYAVASAADEIVATQSAEVGSIGVRCMHVDLSGALEKEGIEVTLIYAGKHKADGNPYNPLPKSVKADVQAKIDDTYEVFVSQVARNRGLDAQVVRDTEAQVYGGQDAKDIGLIDDVATPAEAITAFRSELSGSPKNLGVLVMTDKVNQPGATAAANPDNTAAIATAVSAAKAEATTTATTAERTRINAILTSEEAKDRTDLANHLALSTDLSVEAAKGILKASPAKVAPAAAATVTNNAFAEEMKKNNPNISAGTGDAKTTVDPVTQILSAYAQASGNKVIAKDAA